MKKLEELKTLEKKSEVNVAYCTIISDYTAEEENKRTRILFDEQTGKYYFHQMQNGDVIKCFEIALIWEPFNKFYIFSFTPDDLHICEIDSRRPQVFKYTKLQEAQIFPGMMFSADGLTVEYISENCLKINDRYVEIVKDWNYVYKILKTKIRANGGAKGLFIFLENTAVNNDISDFYWNAFKKQIA